MNARTHAWPTQAYAHCCSPYKYKRSHRERVHTLAHIGLRTHPNARIHTYAYAHAPLLHIRTCMYTHPSYTHARTHTHARTYVRTLARTHTRTHARTHARTHTHTHVYCLSSEMAQFADPKCRVSVLVHVCKRAR